jgi:hypothetical protein
MLTLEFHVYSEIIMTRVTVPSELFRFAGHRGGKDESVMGRRYDPTPTKTDDDAGEWPRQRATQLLAHQVKS